jgi:SsrA-binding protein
MSKKSKTAKSIINSRARYDYNIIKTFVAGIALSGAEVKSLRMGHGHLKGAFVNIKDAELWLFNATITATKTNSNYLKEEMQTQPRKLLIKKKELLELVQAKDQGLAIIPLKVLTNNRYIKIEIATARGLKKFDKREKIKERDQYRAIKRTLKRD